MSNSTIHLRMKNGMPYKIQPCVELGSKHTVEFLKSQIANAVQKMSKKSRFQRFGSIGDSLPENLMNNLTDLNGKEKVALCASVIENGKERGIGLSRYIKLDKNDNSAEFAITVIDEFQNQGIGFELMKNLLNTASNNNIKIFKAYVQSENIKMINLCIRFGAKFTLYDSMMKIAEIQL